MSLTRTGKPLNDWVEVTEEDYWEALEALPPALMFRQGFLLGEQQSTTPEGESVWWAFVELGGGYWRALVTRSGLGIALQALTEQRRRA